MLEISGARENLDYGIAENNQGIWLDHEFAINADWTSLYFNAFVKCFGPSTAYQGVMDRIDGLLESINNGTWQERKNIKDDLKFINEKLLSNSYQAGFENIKNYIQKPEIYETLKKNKLNGKMDVSEMKMRLKELHVFLEQPLCKETFTMKSIVYTFINRFWDGKCFLLRTNAKNDMRDLFEEDFSEPLRQYWRADHKKAKDLCIDCGMPIDSKEKVSIAFMKEMADDLTRKRSAFWDCKVDAFLCPVCAFVYALSPLGFQLFANKFVFVNINESVSELIRANDKMGKKGIQSEREEEKYSAWFARQLNVILAEKTKEISNVQVILRGKDPEDKYMLSIVCKEALEILKQRKVLESLTWLGKHPYVKMGNDFLNVHEEVVMNILQYRNQYQLLNRLLKESIQNEGVIVYAYWVYLIQLWQNIMGRKEKKGEESVMSRISMRNSGYELRKVIMVSKNITSDECLRGTIYQLTNALSVKNEEKFMDIVIRLYSSSKLLMPDGFVYMLGNKEKFQEYGYAFVLGLKGSHPDNKKEEE
ncbi:MAG: type I-B CRISPR-associated protein Cas8b1/Cst1 [Tyzzerella sp.]|nr:type I-B CRISPR-associated protein Cas8b1/Cst1 [Tyzzerella sp.]